MKNIKLFTHTDLDGIGCALIAKLAFANDNLEIEYCDYGNINEKVINFYEENNVQDWDVYITDISVNEEVAEMLNKSARNIKLYDHHPTALWLNKYDWAEVKIEIEIDGEIHKESGTSLFHNDIFFDNSQHSNLTLQNILDMVRNIRMYDTWEWKNKYNDEKPKKLNDLFHLYGRTKFIDEFINRIQSDDFTLFTEKDLEILKAEEEKIDKYIKRKSKQMITKDILGYKAGVVFAEEYVSEMGNRLSTENPELDFIAMIDMGYKTVSYRTTKNNVDVGKNVAKLFGGGGHPQASGHKISDELFSNIVNIIFKN